jgi:hypothetical protein
MAAGKEGRNREAGGPKISKVCEENFGNQPNKQQQKSMGCQKKVGS